jgi:hypothetical protein
MVHALRQLLGRGKVSLLLVAEGHEPLSGEASEVARLPTYMCAWEDMWSYHWLLEQYAYLRLTLIMAGC